MQNKKPESTIIVTKVMVLISSVYTVRYSAEEQVLTSVCKRNSKIPKGQTEIGKSEDRQDHGQQIETRDKPITHNTTLKTKFIFAYFNKFVRQQVSMFNVKSVLITFVCASLGKHFC